jgi:hypothetical protein
MSREEIENRLNELRSKHPQAFIDAEVIDDAKTRRSSVEQSKKKSTKQLAHNKN